VRRSPMLAISSILWLALATGCGAAPTVSVTVSLAPAHTLALPPGGVQVFTATVTGTTDGAVTWTASCGVLSGSGSVVTFTAPTSAATCIVAATSVADPSASDAAIVTVVDAPVNDIVWLRQYATAGGFVVPAAVAVDAIGRVLVTGYASGDLRGASDGRADAFVLQLDAAGEELWRRRFGTTGTDWGAAVAAGPDGHVFVTGYVAGDFDGSDAGRVFLIHFDPDGEELWRRQFGTAPDEYGLGVVADPFGNAFVTWTTTGEVGSPGERAFVSMFGPGGDEIWRRQFDERYPLGSMAVDTAGNVMVTGASDTGIVVVSFTPEGDEVARRSFDLDDVVADAYLLADGRVYLTGTTTLGTVGGEFDVHVTAFAADGERIWRQQFGTDDSDHGRSVAVDGAGNVLAVGATEFPDGFDAEWTDAFLVKLDADGEELWRRLYGAADGGRDWATAVAFGPDGAPVVVGGTHGALAQVAFDAARIDVPFVEAPFEEESGTQLFVMKLAP
jgi:hypothetical protein